LSIIKIRPIVNNRSSTASKLPFPAPGSIRPLPSSIVILKEPMTRKDEQGGLSERDGSQSNYSKKKTLYLQVKGALIGSHIVNVFYG